MTASAAALLVTDEFLEQVAVRAAELVLERVEVTSQTSPTSPFVTVSEAAELLRCKPQRIHDLLLRGRLERAGRDGARVLLDRADVLAYARSDVAPALPRGAAARMAAGVAA